MQSRPNAEIKGTLQILFYYFIQFNIDRNENKIVKIFQFLRIRRSYAKK